MPFEHSRFVDSAGYIHFAAVRSVEMVANSEMRMKHDISSMYSAIRLPFVGAGRILVADQFVLRQRE